MPIDPDAQQVPAQTPLKPDPKIEDLPSSLPPIRTRPATKWPDQPPRPEALLATIQSLSKDRKIGFLDHSEERLLERGFDVFDVFETFEKGRVDGPIIAGRREGEWKAKIINVPDGTSRKMGVVTIVVKEQRLLVKTVEWEDR